MQKQLWVCLALAALVLLAYAPALTQPLIEDDYSNIVQAKVWGPVSGWPEMFGNPIFRVRATTYWLMYSVNRVFGMRAAPYYAVMILLQILNTWLLYALGAWEPLGYRLTAWAAAFFAMYEGHQEAVMWISGSTEPLMLFFGLASFLFWVRFVKSRGAGWYAAAFAAFCLALLSKESAVIWVALLALPLIAARRPVRDFLYLVPFAGVASALAISILRTRTFSFRFQDGSFSLHAPFWLIWPDNFGRLFWFWGVLALIAILVWKPAQYKTILAIGLAWTGIGLIPYSFLTYSLRIPSRQLHLASVGVSLIAGFALLTLYERYWPNRRAIVAAVCAAILVANIGYLWTKKRAQFLERAEPTEQLVAFARATPGPIYVQCFPRPPLIAQSAVQLMTSHPTNDLVWNASDAIRLHAAEFCYRP